MSPFVNEKIFIYTPCTLRGNVAAILADEVPFAGNDPRTIQSFLGWALKKSFSEITGHEPDGFVSIPAMEQLYSLCKKSVDNFVFEMIRDLGPQNIKEHIRYNLVLTYERLYVITY